MHELYELFVFWFIALREGLKKTYWEKVWSFAKPGGGGSARVVKKPNCFFEKKYFSESI